MGLLKTTSESLLKIGEKIFSRTEEYTRIAKLNIDIKKIQNEITESERDIGRLVIQKIKDGAARIEGNDEEIKKYHDSISLMKDKIENNRKEIEEIYRLRAEQKAENSAAQAPKTVKPKTESAPKKETEEAPAAEKSTPEKKSTQGESRDETS